MGEAPDRIRAEIEETRADMSETVDAIGYKADVTAPITPAPPRTDDPLTTAPIGTR